MNPMATAAAGAVLGIGADAIGQGMQVKQQRKLQGMQIQGAKEMGEFNRQQSMKMWNDTNFGAQREHMEKAGLNVGLMYGMGGGGGTTSNVAAGAVSGGNAESGKGAGMGMQLGMQAARATEEIELIKAQKDKAVAEADEVRARTPTHAKGMEKTDQEIKQMAVNMNVSEATIRKILAETQHEGTKEDLTKANITNVEANTKNTEADTQTINALREPIVTGQKIMNLLNDARTKLTEEQAKEVTRNIIAITERIATDKTRNTIQQDANNLQNTRNQIMKELGNRALDVQQQKMIMDGVLKIFPTLGKGSTPEAVPSVTSPWGAYGG